MNCMARVTVEDCIEKVNNRFKLVLMAAKRAKDLERGARASVARDNDKSTIIALREIAEEAISLEGLESIAKQSVVSDYPNTDGIDDDASYFLDQTQASSQVSQDQENVDEAQIDENDTSDSDSEDIDIDEDEEDFEEENNNDTVNDFFNSEDEK